MSDKAGAMKLLHRLPHLDSRRREWATRFRLLRLSLSPSARRAERRADVLLISYPKCGRTWLTLLLSRALANHVGARSVDYLATDMLPGVEGLPRIRISHDDDPHWKTPRSLVRSKRRYRDQKVILLVRDPRDVVVSMYFERSRRERAFDGSLREFLHEPRGSLETILAYYNVWAEQRTSVKDLCLVRYEDLQADAAGSLRRILAFIGLAGVSDADVAEAVEFASFENMRSMEVGDVLGSGRLRARDPRDGESYKTRKGKVGGYVDYLRPAEIAWVEARIRETLEPVYGYAAPAARPTSVQEVTS